MAFLNFYAQVFNKYPSFPPQFIGTDMSIGAEEETEKSTPSRFMTINFHSCYDQTWVYGKIFAGPNAGKHQFLAKEEVVKAKNPQQDSGLQLL